jgi:Ca-activated chloride channel family protein
VFRPGESIRVAGDSVAGAWAHDLNLGLDAQSPGVAALWARARIAELHDNERRGADPAETRAAVVETALAHHLVSKHTSLVAVDKTPVRPAGDPLSSEPVPNLIPHGQSGAAVFGFPPTASDAPGLRFAGTIALLAALLLLAMSALQRKVQHGLAG